MSINYNIDDRIEQLEKSPYFHLSTVHLIKDKPHWIKAHKSHKGAQDFVFWDVPRIQFRNPDLQIVAYKNMTPSPFITCFLEDGNIRNSVFVHFPDLADHQLIMNCRRTSLFRRGLAVQHGDRCEAR